MYGRVEEYNQAKELHEKALVLRKKIFGDVVDTIMTSPGVQRLGVS